MAIRRLNVNKKLYRMGAVALTAALSAGVLMAFAGCTTNDPELTITYTFNGKDYAVDYVLSRTDAPQTVKHFIELADAGYYEGLCVHDYNSNFLYAGGYTVENGDLVEVDYFDKVEKLEEEKGITFTQSVWQAAGSQKAPEKGKGLYTVYGEQEGKVEIEYGRTYRHTQGALVMYYSDKGDKVTERVTISRADGGEATDGKTLQYENYVLNSATSLFYTYLSPSSSPNTELDKKYCVFGMAKDYSGQIENGLLKAIRDYIGEHDEDEDFSFTTTQENVLLNQYERFESVKKSAYTATFETPLDMPIVIKSVKVTKY